MKIEEYFMILHEGTVILAGDISIHSSCCTYLIIESNLSIVQERSDREEIAVSFSTTCIGL
jgi:hypothetical protein